MSMKSEPEISRTPVLLIFRGSTPVSIAIPVPAFAAVRLDAVALIVGYWGGEPDIVIPVPAVISCTPLLPPPPPPPPPPGGMNDISLPTRSNSFGVVKRGNRITNNRFCKTLSGSTGLSLREKRKVFPTELLQNWLLVIGFTVPPHIFTVEDRGKGYPGEPPPPSEWTNRY